MKKEFTTLMLILIGLTGVKAQDVQLVTLQKGEETQVFYGADAFIEAMAAADHGNTITLTAGTFNATNITKAVTIYGAGYETNVDKEKLAELCNIMKSGACTTIAQAIAEYKNQH